MKLIRYITVFLLIVLTSCTHKLNDIGGMQIEGNFNKILILNIDNEELTKIISETINEFGKPTRQNIESKTETYQLTWDNIKLSEFENSKLIISFLKTYSYFNNKEQFLTSSVVFVVMSENGNDLLKNEKSKKRIKEYLETKINNWDF